MTQTNGATPPVPPAPIDPSIVVPLQLTVGQINQILNILGTQPLAEVLTLYSALRMQGDRHIAGLNAAGTIAPPADDPPADPPPPPPPPAPPVASRNPNRKRP